MLPGICAPNAEAAMFAVLREKPGTAGLAAHSGRYANAGLRSFPGQKRTNNAVGGLIQLVQAAR